MQTRVLVSDEVVSTLSSVEEALSLELNSDTQLHHLQAMLGDALASHAINSPTLDNSMDPEPKTHKEAISSSECKVWIEAEKAELDMIQSFHVWGDPVSLPPGAKALNHIESKS